MDYLQPIYAQQVPFIMQFLTNHRYRVFSIENHT